MGDDWKPEVERLAKEVNDLSKRLSKLDGANASSTDTRDYGQPTPRKERNRYPFEYKRGCALIIVNSFNNFHEKSKIKLKGADKDMGLMKDLWVDTLKCSLFLGQIHSNQTAEQMKLLLRGMSFLKREYDYLVVVVSTHGGVYPESVIEANEVESQITCDLTEEKSLRRALSEAGEGQNKNGNFKGFSDSLKKLEGKNSEKKDVEIFFGDDWLPIREREVKQYFYNSNTPATSHGIPKCFILNYCRGSEWDTGDQPMTNTSPPKDVTSLLPSVSDILVVYATHPKFVAWSNGYDGSWLLLTIHEIFKKYYHDTDVVAMLTMVNKVMKAKIAKKLEKLQVGEESAKYKAMSVFESSLDRDLFLEVSEYEENSAPTL